MRVTKVGTPVTSPDGQDGKLGNGDGGTDGGSNFLGGLDTETNVTLRVTDENDGLETGTLTGTGLLLDGFNLREFISSALNPTYPQIRYPQRNRDLSSPPPHTRNSVASQAKTKSRSVPS